MRPSALDTGFMDSTSDMPDGRQRLLGNSPAYYWGDTPPGEQLFSIEELDLLPNPPVV